MRADELVAKWRARATEYRAVAARVDAAALCEELLADASAVEWLATDELLPIDAAVAASGYTAQQLRRLVRQGTLRAHGHGRAVRFARGDLPRKARALAPELPMPHLLGAKTEQVVRARVGASKGTPS